MKKYILFGILAIIVALPMTSCDKVEQIYPPTYSTDLDTTLFDGVWSDYLENEWPNFDEITASTQRNAIIEDFTGHNCSNCPQAATVAHDLHMADPDRIFVASIHSSAIGMSGFQQVTNNYNVDFTNTQGLEIGTFFGQLPGSGFYGNPSGTVNRTTTSDEYFYPAGTWGTKSNEVLSSTLKIALKSHVNYYESTKGAYLHTEVEILDNSVTNPLGMIVYLLEDTLVAPQNVSSTLTPDYVHRDVHRKNISGQTWGRTLTSEMQKENGKYYLDYSFVVPNQLAPQGQTGTHNAGNMHLLIYVYDKTTYEIYQVVKDKFI